MCFRPFRCAVWSSCAHTGATTTAAAAATATAAVATTYRLFIALHSDPLLYIYILAYLYTSTTDGFVADAIALCCVSL